MDSEFQMWLSWPWMDNLCSSLNGQFGLCLFDSLSHGRCSTPHSLVELVLKLSVEAPALRGGILEMGSCAL